MEMSDKTISLAVTLVISLSLLATAWDLSVACHDLYSTLSSARVSCAGRCNSATASCADRTLVYPMIKP